jgi:hypothetical protein
MIPPTQEIYEKHVRNFLEDTTIGRVLEFGVVPYVQLYLRMFMVIHLDTIRLLCENSDENFYVFAIV